MRKVIDFVVLVVALATALAGIALLFPTLVPAALGNPGARYALLGVFLLYTAVTLFGLVFDATPNTGWSPADIVLSVFCWMTFNAMAALIAAAVCAALVFHALVVGQFNIWLGLLAAPGLALLLSEFRPGSSDKKPNDEEPEPAFQGPQPGTGKQGSPPHFFSAIGGGLLMALPYAVFLIVSVMGVLFYGALSAVLFDGASIAPLPFLANVPGRIWHVSKNILPILLFVPAIYLLAEAAGALYRLVTGAYRQKANRDLTPDEVAFVKHCMDKVDECREAERYGYSSAAIGRAELLAYALTGLLLAALGFAAVWLHDRPHVPPGTLALLYLPPDWFGVSGVLAFLTLGLAFIAAPWAVQWLWPYASLHVERQYFTDGRRQELADALARRVRRGKIGPGTPFDARRFLIGLGRSEGRQGTLAALALAAITCAAGVLDFSRYAVVYPDRLVVTDYWTTKELSFPYDAVRAIELRCVAEKGGTPYGYTLLLPDGYEINLVRRLEEDRSFSVYRAVDARLRALKVPARHAMRQPLFQAAVDEYEPGCVRDLAAKYPGEGLARLFRLGR